MNWVIGIAIAIVLFIGCMVAGMGELLQAILSNQ